MRFVPLSILSLSERELFDGGESTNGTRTIHSLSNGTIGQFVVTEGLLFLRTVYELLDNFVLFQL